MPILGIFASQNYPRVVAVQGAYFAGGYSTATATTLSGIDKIDFSNDSISTLSATLTTTRSSLAGAANSGTAAYFAGGQSGVFYSGIDKIAFVGDTKSTLSATLTSARYALAGMANSGTAAYFSGGYDGAFLSGIDKIAFAADTKTTLSATLSPIRTYAQGLANSGVAGYTGPGYTGVGAVYTNTINKILFSNDTVSTLAATLTADGTDVMTAANSGTAGYWAGGAANSGSTLINSIDKLLFSNETKSTISATLTSAIYSGAGAAKSGTAAYFAGGTSPNTARVDKLAFSGDTKSTLSATLSSVRQSMGGAANSGTL